MLEHQFEIDGQETREHNRADVGVKHEQKRFQHPQSLLEVFQTEPVDGRKHS